MLVAASVAERLGVPYVRADFQPHEPTRAFPATFIGPAPAWLRAIRGDGLYNLASHAWTGWGGLVEAELPPGGGRGRSGSPGDRGSGV